MPLKSDWLDLEGEKDTQKQNKEEEIENWDSDLQNWKELEEQELYNNNNKAHQLSLESTSASDTKNSCALISETSETLTPLPSKSFKDRFGNQITLPSEEGQKEDTSEDSLDEINWEGHVRNSVYDL